MADPTEARKALSELIDLLREVDERFLSPEWGIQAPQDASGYGHDLYANLRRLDASGAARIVVEAPPESPEWEAVNDRLARAAAGTRLHDDEP